jgi:iron complex outermembrane receptor protein
MVPVGVSATESQTRALCACLLLSFAIPAAAQGGAALADLSLEELGKVEVTSVSGRAAPLSRAAASIYVITGEDIRRSGVTTLPEALRLAPNLQVARIDASQYAISARGFNNAIANKLLVLIDGRTIYAPYYSGVQWDQHDLVLEDVERIEVISGPGSTIWGANAVNGVINVITRAAKDTQGALVAAGAGNREASGSFRYGTRLGEAGALRVYGKSQQIQNTRTSAGARVADGWERNQLGFRADWQLGRDAFTLQGDAYKGNSEHRTPPGPGALRPIEASGANLLARWTRRFEDGSDLYLQAYYDRSLRDDALLWRPEVSVTDIEFKHSLRRRAHRFLWGGGYRHVRDNIPPGLLFGFVPQSNTMSQTSLFVQDEWSLDQRFTLTAGAKLERNGYTGLELLPTLRLAYQSSPSGLVWAAVSRAVRAPARLDREIRLPAPPLPVFLIAGGPNFRSEVAQVYELGYRGQPNPRLSYSVTAFLHEWEKLRSGMAPPNALVQNRIDGDSYGLEAWGTWQAAQNWRLSAGFTTLRKALQHQSFATDPTGIANLGNDPSYQWQLRSALNLPGRQDLDIALRRVTELPGVVPAYTALDVRYAWHLRSDLEISLTAQNLGDPEHPEFNAAPGRSEIARGVFLRVKWTTQ